LKHNNEELRNTNGCYLVTQFSSNPTNRFILSELSFLAKVRKKFLLFATKSVFLHFAFTAQPDNHTAIENQIKIMWPVTGKNRCRPYD